MCRRSHHPTVRHPAFAAATVGMPFEQQRF
jgi:hypothetical protein